MMVIMHSTNSQNVFMGAIVFKNATVPASNGNWLGVPAEIREQIKTSLFSQLTNLDKVKALSICIGAIAAVEVLQGLWDNFIPTMTHNSTSEPYNKSVRYASMLCLEQFCDFADKVTFSQPVVQNMLFSIT
jgi:hypothetical protein